MDIIYWYCLSPFSDKHFIRKKCIFLRMFCGTSLNSELLTHSLLCSTKYLLSGKKKKKAKTKKNIKTFFLASSLQPAGLKSPLPALMSFLRPPTQLFQVWRSYSEYLLGVGTQVTREVFKEFEESAVYEQMDSSFQFIYRVYHCSTLSGPTLIPEPFISIWCKEIPGYFWRFTSC